MSLATVYSRTVCGIEAPLVTIEVHLSNGLPSFHLLGLSRVAVKESTYRVRSALMHTRCSFPTRRITINLAPADLPKEGAGFDLPIALGILAASEQIAAKILNHYEFVGELGLSGELRPVKSIFPIALSSMRHSKRFLIIPEQNKNEAALTGQKNILYAEHLLDILVHLKKERSLPSCYSTKKSFHIALSPFKTDLADVKGQPHAKRALEIAAAGAHSLLFIGSPGTGKTMLAHCLPSILPPISHADALEIASIQSMSPHGFDPIQWSAVPFRAPHHSSSSAALVGGGRPPKPGEISLSHHGVLFLDEFPEFNKTVLECLREPLELGAITISRAAFQVIFPAKFQLIAAMNPCPCGYAGNVQKHCECSHEIIKRYIRKISGPLLDRIDMHVEMSPITPEMLNITKYSASESSQIVRERVIAARDYQYKRQAKPNALLKVGELEKISAMTAAAQQLLNKIMSKLLLSARSYHRILKLARTIADLELHKTIEERHVSAVLPYRCLDRIT